MTFSVCTENPIEPRNVKSYVLNSYLISLNVCRNIVRQAVDGNHESKSNLVRKCAPYMNAINRYIFNCKEDNF